MCRTQNLYSIQKQNTHEENLELAQDVQKLQQLVGGKKSVSLAIRAQEFVATSQEDKRIIKRGLMSREKLVRGNMRLVLHWLNKSKRIPKTEDYLQFGVMGLCRAAERFDPTRGWKFSTFAYWQVKSAFLAGLYGTSSIVRIPSSSLCSLKRALEQGKKLTPALVAAKSIIDNPPTFLDFTHPEIIDYFLPSDSQPDNLDWELFCDSLDNEELQFVADVTVHNKPLDETTKKYKVNVESLKEFAQDVFNYNQGVSA